MTERFEQFTSYISQIYRCIQRIKSQEMTEFGLKGAHVMCLYNLGRNPQGLTAAELACICAEDKAAISRTIAELERKGFVKYLETSDRRKYRAKLALTDGGIAVTTQFNRIILHAVEQGGSGLTEEERRSFYKALGTIAENLKRLCAQSQGPNA